MRIQLLGDRLPLTSAISDYASKRLETALGRFNARIQGLIVRFSDVNGPKGGADKRCRLVIHVLRLRGAPIVLDEIGNDLYAVIDSVASRAKTAVVRRIGKTKTFTYDSASGQPAT